MYTVLSFLVLIVLIIFGGPLLAYTVNQLLPQLPLDKLINYITLLLALVCSAFWLKYHKLPAKQAFGYGVAKWQFLAQMFGGMLIGILIMIGLYTMLILLGIQQIANDLNMQFLLLYCIKAFAVGLAVGLIEETIFRGAIFSGLQKGAGIFSAIMLSGLLYAAVHFLHHDELAINLQTQGLYSLVIYSQLLAGFISFDMIDYFLTLLALGILLSLIRLRHDNIAACIGVHAGIVMVIKMGKKITDYVADNRYDYLVSEPGHTLGYLAFSWLLLLIMGYCYMTTRSRKTLG